jgi:hypothetical protein
MTEVSADIWEIKLNPKLYYNISDDEHIYKVGMWFRDENNVNLGFGFRNSIIYGDAISYEPIVEIIPASFKADDEIKIIFNARQGNRELVGASKVYLHSGVGIINTNNPAASAWNKVVGNWGADDGVGEMSKISGENDKWQITIKPNTYYGMTNNEFPYWIAAVFRNANGSAKGTTNAGPILNGFVASNLDYFIQNQFVVDIKELENKSDVTFYPNPTNQWVYFKNIEGKSNLMIIDINGKVVMESILSAFEPVNIEPLTKGVYTMIISNNDKLHVGKIVKI